MTTSRPCSVSARPSRLKHRFAAAASLFIALLGTSIADSPASVTARLETALSGGSFRLFDANDAKLLLASIFVRTRRPAESLRLVAGMPTSSQSLYVESVARRQLGDEQGSNQAVIESLLRYPADPRPVVAWLRAKARPFSSAGIALPKRTAGGASDAAVVDAAFRAVDTLKEIDPGILVALAPYASSVDEARLLIREFRAIGGRNVDATLLALGYGLLSESRAIEELLSGAYLPTVSSIRTLYGLLSSDGSRAAFARSFFAYDGMIVSDADRDGFYEATASYRDGMATRWVLDGNQDGVPELEAWFSLGAPEVLRAVSGSMTVTVRYERWPFASSVGFTDAQGSRVYAVGPQVMPLPLITMTPFFASRSDTPYAVERSSMNLPSERSIVSVANSVRSETDDLAETAELSGGMRNRAWWSDAFGWHGYLTYLDGVPKDESLDLDGDGRFEARRIWKRDADGLPVASYIEADQDGDGMFEYRESLSQPVLKSWDYDGNGEPDLTLEERQDGSRVYRFRASGGSDYRVEATYSSGRVDSVTERGVPLPLVADTGGSVVWIGRKPFDFGTTVPTPGFGSRLGQRYVVVAIGGLLYAQVLE
jgi:hypothetical protein